MKTYFNTFQKQPLEVFLKISQNSQENNYVGIFFFNKNAGIADPLANLLAKRVQCRCFPMSFVDKLKTCFTEHPRVTDFNIYFAIKTYFYR